MTKIINFTEFLNEEAGLSSMNLKVNSLELILSKKFRKVLKNVDHVISDKLLELHKDSEPIYKQTFIDLADESDKVSFIQANKVIELLEPEIRHDAWYRSEEDKKTNSFNPGSYPITTVTKNKWISDVNHVLDLHFVEEDSPVWTKYRSTMKIAAFVNKIFGNNSFPNNYTRTKRDEILAAGKKLDDVESFVFMFQSEADKNIKKFEIVKGEDIVYWYNENRYFDGGGNLGSSCMRYPEKSEYMNFYAENPDKISMLILHPEQDHTKIIGRAILWNLDSPSGKKYMDRIYVSKDTYEYMFINWAKTNKYMYKSSQTYGPDYEIVDTNDTRSQMTLAVQLNVKEYEKFPYLDTLQYFDTEKCILTNDTDYKPGRYVRLTSDSGGYHNY